MLSRLLVRNYSSSTFQETKRIVESSTLSNGLKVVSLVGGYTGPAVSLGLYIKSGSRNETQATAGLNQVLKGLAFESNTNKLGIEVQREIETSGSTAFVQAGRDNLLISTQTLPNQSLQMLKNLANITQPTLPYHEVRDVAEVIAEESEAYNHCPTTSILESAHQTAFRGKTLGRPLVAPLCNLSNISQEVVSDYVNATYKPNNMVLVGVGLSHGELVEEAEKVTFGTTVNSTTTVPREAAKYIGGESLTYATGNTKVVLAFEGSAQTNIKNVAALTVLQTILGNGSPKVAPGNGRASRLFSLTQNNTGIVRSEAFNLSYADTGLFGVLVEVEGSNVAKTLSLLTSEISASTKATGKELERAKALAKVDVLEQADSRSGALEFIGKQAIYSDKIYTPVEFAEEINNVTAEDIQRVAKTLVSSKPTLVVVGDVSDVPTFESLKL
ncbi:hypothetical protein DICPUDRAFT_75529 [Dictyostelium purpureum]|uniref:Uncharacterized protein n=1 Tax=Dictyostelium purpureum TaxID=5786 RepID=F0ZAX2_DICPU|nr:uncharacterized protein DICPUDRAFT_75529 [Dictyostelium purpureum]EGC38904.1 hypothetical protein DICPUDRAFT_75529 [Dictyostelium purpureum]|eukprot:XP_003284584.1 hypothetical protein DICPUDRAFT_75529 [Dictyostelium purpureum]